MLLQRKLTARCELVTLIYRLSMKLFSALDALPEPLCAVWSCPSVRSVQAWMEAVRRASA